MRGNEVVTIEKNLVMHIAGRQLVKIDGGTDGARDAANALTAFAAAFEAAATAAPPVVAAPDPPPEREGVEAVLTLRVATLPWNSRGTGTVCRAWSRPRSPRFPRSAPRRRRRSASARGSRP
ncbi:MAG: hypothetical protein IT373_18790 [Polyangiaceae bacterium]|nr:hypothetical protein [Polyangiaceae bacterium]